MINGEREQNGLQPIDTQRLATNQVVQVSTEFGGKIVETFKLRVLSVSGVGGKRLFRLEDLVGRPYEVTAPEIDVGRQGILRFDGVVPGSFEEFVRVSSSIRNGNRK